MLRQNLHIVLYHEPGRRGSNLRYRQDMYYE